MSNTDLIERLRNIALDDAEHPCALAADALVQAEMERIRLMGIVVGLMRAEQDARRLEYLIANAYSGLNKALKKPHAVGLVVGGEIAWPNGVRAAIDAELAKEEKDG